MDVRDEERLIQAEAAEDLIEVQLEAGELNRPVSIGASLVHNIKNNVTSSLRRNKDLFAWSHDDMPGINPKITAHYLCADPLVRPVRQKKRVFAPERNKVALEEVDKLLRDRLIREVNYPDWLSNVVLVKKSNGKWRMYVDFTDLNRACPKDSFPLPRIDQMVDSTSGHDLLSFMDAFSGYN